MEKRFEGRVALVTGGGTGLGRAVALAFAREGAMLVIANRNPESGNSCVAEIRESGGTAIFVPTDVRHGAQIEALVKKTVATFERLDYAFNNAGILGAFKPTASLTEEEYDEIMDTNVKGVWLCMKYQIRQMLRQRKGVIINNSSINGLVPLQNVPIYTTSKHALVGLTKNAAIEYATRGIRINCVCPGPFHTAMLESSAEYYADGDVSSGLNKFGNATALRRLGKPEELAHLVLWLCTEEAAFVIGQTFVMDGGMTLSRP
ncbi:MAG: glucose 1-dehydrogenase, partial [Hyphomicrobiales bacterium]|nr:glucose 1-dehydrogenase [Hyphomicrobiales bacterium]